MDMILLRHTKPAAAQGLCYGRTDLAVGPCFAAHAGRIVQELPQVSRVVTSPLSRCLALAEFVADARGLGLTIDPRLTEMDFGAWEGRPWADIPRAELDVWAADLLHARPHGGESVAALRDRSLAALRDHAGPGVLVVTHHGVIKSARWRVMGDDAWQSEVKFGGTLPFAPGMFADV